MYNKIGGIKLRTWSYARLFLNIKQSWLFLYVKYCLCYWVKKNSDNIAEEKWNVKITMVTFHVLRDCKAQVAPLRMREVLKFTFHTSALHGVKSLVTSD